MNISKANIRTAFIVSFFLIGLLTQFAQHGEILGVKVSRSEVTPAPTVAPSPSLVPSSTPSAELYKVVSVTDGDTLKVLIGDIKTTVRIVGINTPETVDPRKPVECFGKEASAKLKSLIVNQNVKLETDVTQGDKDRYDRLLRFVFTENGADVGKQMIQEGFAYESLYSSVPHKYRSDYVQAQKEAQEKKVGLWAESGGCAALL